MQHSRSDTINQRNHYSLTHSRRNPYSFEESNKILEMSPFKHQRRRYEQKQLQGYIRKIEPPTFDGENNMGEDDESWFLGIKKYFLIPNNQAPASSPKWICAYLLL